MPDGIGRAVKPRRFTVTARCTDNSGEALQGVRGGQMRIGRRRGGERFAGVAFGLLGLTLSGRDTAGARSERRCHTAADGRRYGLIGPPPCVSHLASGQCDVGSPEEAGHVQSGLSAQPIRGHRRGHRRGRDIACRK